jgi:hypothetical protein
MHVGQGCGLDSSDTEQGPVASSSKHSHKPSDAIKCWEFLELA